MRQDCLALTPADRARALGFSVVHSPGCPGVHFPGVGIVWDEGVSDAVKHAVLDAAESRLRVPVRK